MAKIRLLYFRFAKISWHHYYVIIF